MTTGEGGSSHESRRRAESEKYPLDLPVPDPFLERIAVELLETTNGTSVIITFFGNDRTLVKAWAGQNVGISTKAMFCSLALYRGGYVEIEDMLNHPFFKHDPLVFSSPMVRAFSSTPVTNSSGFILGALCVLNRKPTRITEQQRVQIAALSREVMDYLEEKRSEHGA